MVSRVTTALLLAALASPAAAQAPAGAPVEVALRTHGGRLIVPVRSANGEDLEFIVSTGSTATVLTESAAKRVGDAGLTLGGLTVPMDGSQTVPDGSLTTAGTRFDGMIGGNMLSAYDVLFDAPGGRLVLKPVGRAVEWKGESLSEPVRLRVYHGVILGLDVELGGAPYPAMLDLGTPALLVNAAVVKAGGVAGGKAGTLRLGSVTFRDLPAAESDHPVIQRFSPNGDGFVLVGAPIALECAVSVSWVHRELRTCVR